MARVINVPAKPDAFRRNVQSILGEVDDWAKIRYWVLYAWNRGIKELFKDPSLHGWHPHDPETVFARQQRHGYYKAQPERGARGHVNLWRGVMRNELSLQRSLSRAKLRGLSEKFRPFQLTSDLARVPYAQHALKHRPFRRSHEKWISLQVDQYVNYQLLRNYQRLTGG